MKKIAILLSALMLCLALCACGENAAPAEPAPAEPAPAEAEETPAVIDEGAAPSTDAAMNAAYGAMLQTLMTDHTLPDGTDLSFEPSQNMADNQFAVYDVDGDGKDELIVLYSTTFSAGMAGCVFAYDGENEPLRTELFEFPMLTFYDNGVITAGWSHGTGLADEPWPFNIYVYDAESDSYGFAASVSAWDKATAPTDFSGDAFPADADTSGTGIVYYISAAGQFDDTVPQDYATYSAFIAPYTGTSELSLEWYGLTEENIASLMA